MTFYPCSPTRMSQFYTCFVTNICHYFDLLHKICGKIHAVTYYNVSYGGKKQHVLCIIRLVNIHISPTLSLFAPYRV